MKNSEEEHIARIKRGRQKERERRRPDGGHKAGNANWLDACIKGETQKPLPILANVLIGLRAQWPNHFAYDEMFCAPVLARPLVADENFTAHPVTDVVIGILQEQLQHVGLKRIAKDIVHQAVDVVAHERRFHPVRTYLNRLEWDGTPRLDKMLSDYFGAEQTAYTESVGAMFLVSMVARIMAPGSKVDHCLSLKARKAR